MPSRNTLRRTIRRLRRDNLRLLAIAEDQIQTIHYYSTRINNDQEARSCKICLSGVSAKYVATPCGHTVSISDLIYKSFTCSNVNLNIQLYDYCNIFKNLKACGQCFDNWLILRAPDGTLSTGTHRTCPFCNLRVRNVVRIFYP